MMSPKASVALVLVLASFARANLLVSKQLMMAPAPKATASPVQPKVAIQPVVVSQPEPAHEPIASIQHIAQPPIQHIAQPPQAAVPVALPVADEPVMHILPFMGHGPAVAQPPQTAVPVKKNEPVEDVLIMPLLEHSKHVVLTKHIKPVLSPEYYDNSGEVEKHYNPTVQALEHGEHKLTYINDAGHEACLVCEPFQGCGCTDVAALRCELNRMKQKLIRLRELTNPQHLAAAAPVIHH